MLKHFLLLLSCVFTLLSTHAQQVAGDKLICGTGIEFETLLKDNNNVWRIASVKKASSAWYAGFMKGDVIYSVRINDKSIILDKETTKAKLEEYLTGDFNKEIKIGITRSDEKDTPVLYSYAHCSVILNKPELVKTGGCVNGDCINGKGNYIDASGTIYSGTFLNGKLNGAGCDVSAGEGSYSYSGNYENGVKSGKGSIQYGQRLITSVSTANGYFGNFENDQPHGTGHVALLNGNTYSAEYENGKIKGFVKYTYNNGDYCLCDAAHNYKPVKCYSAEGVEIGLLEQPK